MKDAFAAVTEFHNTYGVPAPDRPQTLSTDRQSLRYRLIDEEYGEYKEAVEAGDLVAISDALADLAYVVLGAAVEHGLVRFGEMFDEVHRSNMSKLGDDGHPMRRDDGKIIKGPNFSPPNLSQFL